MLNIIIAALALFGAIDEKGWVSVERPQKAEAAQVVDESDTTWPVFSKQFGEDRVLVRFPVEPTYTYPRISENDRETIQVEASTPVATHRFIALPSTLTLDAVLEQKKLSIPSEGDALLVSSERTGPNSIQLLYRSDKMWVRERIVASSDRVYILQTLSESLNESEHLKFSNSFDLEIRGKNQVFHREFQSEK
ncbi:MAG TPA: hypothetical protein DCE71_04060 [Parachlamydiales bacterium]|nr:hypothetical protein [Parachlamydiales bacterium]